MDYPTILEIIYSFYDKAKSDFMIGYHFRFIEDFDEHIPRIADFWNLQLNGNLNNRANLPFNLINTHKPLGIKSAEIGRWVILFEMTLDESVASGKISAEGKIDWMKKVDLFKEKLVLLL